MEINPALQEVLDKIGSYTKQGLGWKGQTTRAQGEAMGLQAQILAKLQGQEMEGKQAMELQKGKLGLEEANATREANIRREGLGIEQQKVNKLLNLNVPFTPEKPVSANTASPTPDAVTPPVSEPPKPSGMTSTTSPEPEKKTDFLGGLKRVGAGLLKNMEMASPLVYSSMGLGRKIGDTIYDKAYGNGGFLPAGTRALVGDKGGKEAVVLFDDRQTPGGPVQTGAGIRQFENVMSPTAPPAAAAAPGIAPNPTPGQLPPRSGLGSGLPAGVIRNDETGEVVIVKSNPNEGRQELNLGQHLALMEGKAKQLTAQAHMKAAEEAGKANLQEKQDKDTIRREQMFETALAAVTPKSMTTGEPNRVAGLYEIMQSETPVPEAYRPAVDKLRKQEQMFIQHFAKANKITDMTPEKVLIARKMFKGMLSQEMPEQRQGGGGIKPNKAYLVGEKGPEVIVTNKPGVVIPNAALPKVQPMTGPGKLPTKLDLPFMEKTLGWGANPAPATPPSLTDSARNVVGGIGAKVSDTAARVGNFLEQMIGQGGLVDRRKVELEKRMKE